MKIQLKKDSHVNGILQKAGTIHDLTDNQAKDLIAAKKALPVYQEKEIKNTSLTGFIKRLFRGS